jgi:hypothetical protein
MTDLMMFIVIGWVIFSFIVGFLLGIFVGHRVASMRAPEVMYIRDLIERGKLHNNGLEKTTTRKHRRH